jgi:hypothetical protein
MAAATRSTPPTKIQNTSPPTGYVLVPGASTQVPGKSGQYHLKHYIWRSFLTVTAPLAVLAFYAFICFHFLAYPLANNVFAFTTVDAIWIYYSWFLLAVFSLDWARTGLANIEASALMVPLLAPLTARELMWHTDNNWANPLWWLRAVRAMLWKLFLRIRYRSQASMSVPGALWMMLSFVHALLFMVIPLSGLSMEVVDASTYDTRDVPIYGPNASSFNSRTYLDLPLSVRRNWESGRQTSPSRGTILYAPHLTKNVSPTYFDDRAIEAARKLDGTVIRVFAGPAVRETIWGEAWGLSANISCTPTPLDELQMIRSDGNTSSVKICSTREGCEFEWLSTDDATQRNSGEEHKLNIPVWLNESRSLEPTNGLHSHSLLAAADGWSTTVFDHPLNTTISPYNRFSNHDEWTFDHALKGVQQEDITNSLFEILLWQASDSDSRTTDDEIFTNYIKHPSPLLSVHNGTTNLIRKNGTGFSGVMIGIGVHCDIKSAVGTATLDPNERTFSNFMRGKADPSHTLTFFPLDVAPVQIQAMASIASNQHWTNLNGSLATQETLGLAYPDIELADSILSRAQRAVGSAMLPKPGLPYLYYPTLTPQNLTLAMYKLLGESVISLMGEGGVYPWTSSTIHGLKPAKYLRRGAVPWQLVLAILAVWAALMSVSALWALLFIGPRWAPSLSGFELFKFGAQYQAEINQLETVDFKSCIQSLGAIPGMVGILPGKGKVANDLGFIGLSHTVAERSRGAGYTLDRENALKLQHP